MAAVIAGIAAIAGTAHLIYQNWDDIVSFFGGIWDSVKAAFDEGFIQGVAKLLETFNPAIWIAKGVNGLIETLLGVPSRMMTFPLGDLAS